MPQGSSAVRPANGLYLYLYTRFQASATIYLRHSSSYDVTWLRMAVGNNLRRVTFQKSEGLNIFF